MTASIGMEGDYFPPLTSRSEPARLVLCGKSVTLVFQNGRTETGMTVQSQQGIDNIILTNGGYFKSAHPIPPEAMDHIHSGLRQNIMWLESFSWPKAIAMLVLFVVSIAALRIGISSSTGLVAQIFPYSWEEMIGRSAYRSMKSAILEPSAISVERQQRLIERADKMAQQASLKRTVDIYFHQSTALGANALAFPGGPIIVTDGLVKLLDSDEEVLAIIAHEYGHIRDRHSLKQTVDLFGTSILLSFIFGADDSLIEEVAALAANGWAYSNSRDFEREADHAAYEILSAAGLPPESFLSSMRTLTEYGCRQTKAQDLEKCITEGETSWHSTHPSGAERLQNFEKLVREK